MDDAVTEVLERMSELANATGSMSPRELLAEEGVNPEQWSVAMESLYRTALTHFAPEHVPPFLMNAAFLAGMHYERAVQEALKGGAQANDA